MNTSKYLSLIVPTAALVLASSATAKDSETIKYMDNPSAPSSISKSETTVEQSPSVLMEGQNGSTTVIEQPGSTKTTSIEKQTVPEPTTESKPVTVKKKKDSHHFLHLGIPFVKANVF